MRTRSHSWIAGPLLVALVLGAGVLLAQADTAPPVTPKAPPPAGKAPAATAKTTPGVKESPDAGMTAININTAGVTELMKLDGVGKKLAEKIVEYRDAHGAFKKPSEIRRVQGVGAGLWEKNRERIVVK